MVTGPLPFCVAPPALAFMLNEIEAVRGALITIEPKFAFREDEVTESGALIVIEPPDAVRVNALKVTA